jgi:ABC-type multidrug transport system fused ATPase/permease subunit
MYLELFKNILKFYKILISFKNKFFFLFFLTLLTALTEIIFITSIIPLFKVLFNQDLGDNNYFEKIIYIIFSKEIFSNKLIFFATIFVSLAILVNFLRILLLKYSLNLTATISAYTGEILFKQTLYKTYTFHVKENSSNLIATIIQKNNDISNSLMSIIFLFSSIILFFSIFLLLNYFTSTLILIVSFIYLITYLIIEFFSRKTLFDNSKLIAENQNIVVKSLQEGFGAIKEIILQNLQKFYLKLFSNSNLIIQNMTAVNRYINQFPRYIIEMLTLIIFSIIIIFYELKNLNIVEILPVLTVIAISSQRLLPLMQQIYFHSMNIVSKKSALDDYLKIYDNEIDYYNHSKKKIKIEFSKKIIFENVSFHYTNRQIFKNMNFEIQKGLKIGIIGQTGIGKTTFINLLAGLVQPKDGKILVDNFNLSNENIESWTSEITYVPQEIFLFDSTIAQNIAVGEEIENIDFHRLKKACESAQIIEVINLKKSGFYEIVGEKGIKLSAGERQRIGLARAFYKNPNFLVLDEATSALDYKTENLVMNNVYNLNKNKTLIIIAHRINSLKYCDKIYQISNFKIEKVENCFVN